MDEDFKKLTNGSGATNKKHEFLRGWLSDGCSVGPSFRKAQLAFEALDRHKTEVQWISWKQVCKKFGKKEALQRLENGSLKYRRSPSDTRLCLNYKRLLFLYIILIPKP